MTGPITHVMSGRKRLLCLAVPKNKTEGKLSNLLKSTGNLHQNYGGNYSGMAIFRCGLGIPLEVSKI